MAYLTYTVLGDKTYKVRLSRKNANKACEMFNDASMGKGDGAIWFKFAYTNFFGRKCQIVAINVTHVSVR